MLPGAAIDTLDGALVLGSVEHGFALLGTVFLLHRLLDLRSLFGQRHGVIWRTTPVTTVGLVSEGRQAIFTAALQ